MVHRYYYHELIDQYNNKIDLIGIPCREVCTWHSGKKGLSKKPIGDTLYYPPDDAFLGGVAQQDELGCNIQLFNGIYHQDLYIGTPLIPPQYDMYLTPLFPNPSGDRVWKELRSLP